MSNVARLKPLDRLTAVIPLVPFEKLDLCQPALVRVLIDSEIAKKMLDLNIKNRRQRRAAVEYLKKQIHGGEWRDDHPQPVIFSDQGRLIDGQHRIQAISEMQIDKEHALIIRVETGARDDVREYLDTGVPRTLDDRVELVEDLLHNKIIAQLCAFETNSKRQLVKRPTPDDAREFFNVHQESALFVARNMKRDKGVGRIQVAYAAMEYYEINREKAYEFYVAIFVPDTSVQPARMLRDWLLRSNPAFGENTGSTRVEVYERAVFCMKSHMAGKTVSAVRRAQW